MEEIKNMQKGDNNTQIGQINTEKKNITVSVQNVGLQPKDACELAMKLFYENFPKLQEEAEKTVRARVEELCSEIVNKIVASNGGNFSSFSDPDIQYCLIKAQEDYARFGTKELKERLATLISKRVCYDSEFKVKTVIDQAIQTAKYLASNDLDFLSIIFYAKHVKFGGIDNALNKLEALKLRINKIALQFPNANQNSFNIVNNFGCLQLNLDTTSKRLSKTYNISETDAKAICPQIFMDVPADYGLSYTGIALAIINIEIKTGEKNNLKIWIE